MEVAADLSAFWLASEERGAKTSSSASSTSEPSSDFGSGSQSWEAMTPSGVTGKVVGLNPLSRMWVGTLPAVWWTALAAAAVALFVAEAALIYDWSTSSLKREIAEVQQDLRASQTRVGSLEAENNALERENMRLSEVSDTLAEAEKTIERLSQEQKHTDAAMAELKQLRTEKEAMATASQPPSESQVAATETPLVTNEQAPSPQELLNGEVFTNSIGMKLRLIPAGTFTMGDATGLGDEKPPHRVTLTKAFYIGIYEVTNAQFEKVMGKRPAKPLHDNGPVSLVSWNDAAAFCQKLSALPSERQAGNVYRLPTEAEWEYACRAGTTTKYSFGDDESRLDDYGWFRGDSGFQTHPVGQKKPNAWGLYDMHGNVWEWVGDWYDFAYYPQSPETNPRGPNSGRERVFRGGGVSSLGGHWYCRSAHRNGRNPSDKWEGLGFRLVCEAKKPTSLREEKTTEASTEPTASTPQDSDNSGTLTNSIGVKFAMIPAGTFTMGDATGFGDEKPPHQVTLTKPFYMGVYEVTNAQYKRVMDNTPSKWKDDHRPVEQVSWQEAREFCGKLSQLPEERDAGRVYRLPTEAEWEYACRAGTKTKYSFGNNEKLLGNFGWFDGNGDDRTHAVGLKKSNAWGLYDMHGNVHEWVSDWYDPGYYANSPREDPLGSSAGTRRVRRGGSYFSYANVCGGAYRHSAVPVLQLCSLGFRLAMSLPGSNPPASKD